MGKVFEYYYCHYQLYKTRDARRAKFNFEQLAEEDLKRVFKDYDETHEQQIEKKTVNPHDYVDDSLLDKLFYNTNARQSYFGSTMAINGLIGFSVALSAHYLFKQLRKWLDDIEIENDNDNDIDIEYEEANTVEIRSIWDEIKSHIQSSFVRNAHHTLMLGINSKYIFNVLYLYILQNIDKANEKGGYGYLNAGPGRYGVDLGWVTSIISGILVYPLVLNVSEIWKWKKKLQSQKRQRQNVIMHNDNDNNNNKQNMDKL